MPEIATRHDLGEAVLGLLRAAFPDVCVSRCGSSVNETCIAVPVSCLVPAVAALMDGLGLWHLSAITGDLVPAATGQGGDLRLLYHIWHGAGIALAVDLPAAAPCVPTLTGLIPGAAFYERELHGMFGVEFEGHHDLRPLLLPDDWEGAPPMLDGRAGAAPDGAQQEGARAYVGPPRAPGTQSEGCGSWRSETVGTPPRKWAAPHPSDCQTHPRPPVSRVVVPIGPQHPLLKEPVSFRLSLEGEVVTESTMRIGYVHRGIERLCQERTYVQNVHLVERVCGICSHVHATTYCRAVEALAGIEVPARARYLRALLCELERIHSHLLWLGVLAHNIGFDTIFMYAWRDREGALDIMEDLSGGRVSHGVNLIGGVRIDLDAARRETILRRLDEIETQVERLLGVVEHERTLQARTRGIGVLTLDDVYRHCVVGPVARASGLDVDLRRDDPQPPYDRLSFAVPVHTAGDVWARTLVRVQEAVESVHLCRQILHTLPDGPVKVRVPRRIPAGEAVVRSEAPRGEVFYYVRADGSDHPARVKIRTPTLTNLITLPHQLQGVAMADVSVVLSGVDLCIACADR